MIIYRWYLRLFNFIAQKRIQQDDVDLRKIHTHTVAVLSTGLLMWAYAFLAWITIASPVPGAVGFICSAVHLLSPLLFRFSANAFMISNIMIGAGMLHQSTFTYYSGGFSSDILIWFGILPMLAGIIAGRRAAVFWAIACTICASGYLFLELSGHPFPSVITPMGKLLAHAFLVFGWIFLSTSIIYVLLILNEQRERLLAEQGQKIDDLFRVLFHDLAGPLSRISIGLNISKKNESREHGIEIASKAAESMIEITQNVRRMYAVSKGKATSDLTLCPLNEAIEYIEKLFSTELEQKKIKVKYDFKANQGVKVLVEPVSFKNQVLGNVFSNAIKFSPPESTINVQSTPIGRGQLMIEIKDQGIGMSPALIESLFDITKKTSRSGTAGESGTGFGMHILKSFVDMYQGQLDVQSSEDKTNHGTSIKITLKAQTN